MASYVKYNCFAQDVGRKVHNLNTDVLKIALTNAAPNVATHTVLADITEIAAANGYSAGGNTPTNSGYSQTSGTGKLILVDTVFTASGGSIAQFRYVVLYNSTASGGPLIAYWDYGSGLTLASGDTLTVDFDGSAGVLTLA